MESGISNSNLLIQVEIVTISDEKIGYIRSHLEHRVEPFEDDVITTAIPYASFEELEPIPLSTSFLQKFVENIKYPKWINYVHELQNWYYWQNEKKELELVD